MSFLARLSAITLAGVALILVWRWSAGPPPGGDDSPPDSKPQPTASARLVEPRGDLAADERSTIELFERTRDAVVFIATSQEVRDPWSRNVMSVPRGTGSGFVWDESGHVVTNFHVIAGASEAIVKLADGRDYRASLVGASRAHDIAVLRIGVQIRRPPAVPLGRSGDLKVGQKVFAIGNPFGLDWTLTTGIVSALDRSLPGDSGVNIEHLIQTDAAINPGNSGGPLLDSAGRLIGINTSIYSPSGASAGIGFAVPVDTVNRVVPQLIKTGRYQPPSLGIDTDERWNERFSQALGQPGVYVLRVQKGGAAEKAGMTGARMRADGALLAGDVVLAIEGRAVSSPAALAGRLDEFAIGQTVSIELLRSGQKQTVSVMLQ